jgi:hypothetical protein
MNRRGFLGFLGAALAGATLDPERLLWQPGCKLISIPRAIITPENPLLDEINAITLAYLRKSVIEDNFFVSGPWAEDFLRHVR